MRQLSTSRTSILWRQVWGLAALLAAILFSFMAYGIYQPKILKSLGFVELASWLGIVQGLLGAVIEPLVGAISDRILRKFGSRLPIISAGVTLAGLVFVVVGVLLQGNLPPVTHIFVPILMTIWVIAMIIFRGPAIALLIQFAPLAELPKASAIIVLVMGLVGAFGPLLSILLTNLGTSPTFILGAIALVIGASLLFSSTPQHTLILPEQTRDSPGSLQHLGAIFLVGVGAGLEINLLLGIFSQVLKNQLFGSITTEWISSAILLIAALIAVPLERITIKLGVINAMRISLGVLIGLMGLTLLNHSPVIAVGLLIAFSCAFGLIFITQIPFALGMVAASHAGLGTGLYFGGMGAATALFSMLMKLPGGLTPSVAVVWGVCAFLIASASLTVCWRQAPQKLPR
jgi:MFS family permease